MTESKDNGKPINVSAYLKQSEIADKIALKRAVDFANHYSSGTQDLREILEDNVSVLSLEEALKKSDEMLSEFFEDISVSDDTRKKEIK